MCAVCCVRPVCYPLPLLAVQVQREVALTHTLNHPNVVRFLSWYSTKGHVWLVVELCAGGSLDLVLRQDRRLPPAAVKVTRERGS